MKVLVRVKMLNDLERTNIYKVADDIDKGRKIAMKIAKSKPYDWVEIYTINKTYLGSLQYRSERKDYVYSGKNVKSSKTARIVRPDGSLGSEIKLW